MVHSSTTCLPLKSDRRTVFPLVSLSVKSGAGWPTVAAAWAPKATRAAVAINVRRSNFMAGLLKGWRVVESREGYNWAMVARTSSTLSTSVNTTGGLPGR